MKTNKSFLQNAQRTMLLFDTAILLAIVCLAPGCASTNPAHLNSAAQAKIAEPAPFVAPNDPAMGQIVVSIPEVSVSAPVTATAGNLGQLVRSQLASYLSQSPNFIVADREALVEIGQEHKLAEAGATDPRDKPVSGRLAGARYLIKVDVTDFKEDVVGNAKSTRFETGGILRLIGTFAGGQAGNILTTIAPINPTFGKGKETVHGVVGMEVRIVDVDTGSIVRATRASGSLTRENTRTIFGVAGFSTTDNSFNQSVIAQSMRQAAQDAVKQIHGIFREQALARTQNQLASAPR